MGAPLPRLHALAVVALAASHLPAAAPPSAPLRQRIDQLISAKNDFVRHKAPRCSDAEFVRRIYLDLTGKIPSVAEARAFLADKAADKRATLVARLLKSPECARHLATTFDVMIMERIPDQQVPRAVWMEFLRKSFESNKPYNEIVREILSGDDPDGKNRHRVK